MTQTFAVLERMKKRKMVAEALHHATERPGDVMDILGNKVGLKHTAAGTPTYTQLHGPGGLLGGLGNDSMVLSALFYGMGLAGALPVLPRVTVKADDGTDTDPHMVQLSEASAGDSEDYANQPDAPCDNPPSSSELKQCTTNAPWGRYYFATDELLMDTIGDRFNRGEFDDLRLVGTPLIEGFQPDDTPKDPLTSEYAKLIYQVAVSVARFLGSRISIADPTNDKVGGGAKEFNGTDLLINTGTVDIYGAACAALDSEIYDFGSTDITQPQAVTGYFIYQIIQDKFRILERNRRVMGYASATYALRMHPDMFNGLTLIWPVLEHLYSINTMAALNNVVVEGGTVNLSGDQTLARTNELRNNSYLPVNGVNLPVIQDDFVVQTETAPESGIWVSDIEIINMTANGLPMTYWNPRQMANKDTMEIVKKVGGESFKFHDKGSIMSWVNRVNACLTINFMIKPRVMLHLPQLCARIENVAVTPITLVRSALPSGPNFKGGGSAGVTPSP